MGMFWLNPRQYLAIDSRNRTYLAHCGINAKVSTVEGYLQLLEEVIAKLGNDFPSISRQAYLFTQEKTGPSRSPLSPKLADRRYWWLNANPNIWNLDEITVGETKTYTSYNEKGNKRQKYKYFTEVKPGDLVVGYVTTPQREIIAICEITKGLHQSDQGERIEFKKIEQLQNPVAYEELKSTPALAHSEPLVNNQGSLFGLTEDEFDIIRAIIDEKTPVTKTPPIAPYTKRDALLELFLSEQELNGILSRLQRKKNIILQGPPGVGKTFVARRLAYLMMGVKDASRVQMVQFHQSYAYEDFIQGYRPNEEGRFTIKPGIFYEFCRKAQRDPENEHFFIIDEINRGNLSKIFGELMMLIENDKRGQGFAMPLTYAKSADDLFYISENLYLIGMMNTADRSLSLVDYALRRRFAFVTLQPKFTSDQFNRTLTEAGASAVLIRKICERIGALNKEIAEDERNLGPGYCIGHSYFCPGPDPRPLDESWYREVIESEIKPLLEEYWVDESSRVNEQVVRLLA
jgi:5-methylcytosine-specific restriction protein B